MKPVTPFDNFPSFGNAGARQAPGDAKYAQGFLAADTLPAEWANYFFHGSTKGISDLNTAVRSIWLELSSVLTAYNITADASQTDQLYQAIEKRISSLYPIGTVYQNADSDKNPGRSDMLGFGTWEPITDKFLAARGSTNIGASGGQWSFTLTGDNIPRHKHTVDNHTHGMQHCHYTNITHGHPVSDQGHFHTVPSARVALGSDWGGSYPKNTYRLDYTYDIGLHTTKELTGIAVVDLAYDNAWRFSSGALANAQWVGRTETDGATPGTDYQYSANPTAISITPTYIGVYTWKRTA